MAQLVLYAMPNHLRPSKSYKGLTKNSLESPSTFKDRVYLTDIADSLWQVLSGQFNDIRIDILWRRRYFPWRIKIEREGDGHVLLEGKIYGESTWTSCVEMQIKDLEKGKDVDIDDILGKFVLLLGRPPYESPYWDDATWQKFLDEKQLTRRSVEAGWAKYLKVLEEE